ncbi:MAG: alpha/beta hydrolase, partial [Alphaproteobacteria bacterium]|nr:alpha/beta hydrolase [Alphaproteobacteria bacterium]
PQISKIFDIEPIGPTDLWQFWDAMDIPTLTIRGEKSVLLTNDIVAEMSRRKPAPPMDFTEIKDAGHVPSLMAPDQIEMVRSWLKSAPTS